MAEEQSALKRLSLTACGAVLKLKDAASTRWRNRQAALFIVAAALTLSVISAAQSRDRDPPILRNNSAQFIFIRPVSAAPTTVVQAIGGSSLNLQQFRGKVVLVSFWATWCQPCAAELPSLDRLAARADPSRLAIVAVSIDSAGTSAVIPFVQSHRLTHLIVAIDPSQRLGAIDNNATPTDALPISALPITYLIDRENRVIGYITGVTDWTSPAAVSFLNYFVNSA